MKARYSVITSVANQEGVSENEVYEEIQKAIDIGFHNADPKIQAEWRKISRDGKKPTPEQVIRHCKKNTMFLLNSIAKAPV